MTVAKIIEVISVSKTSFDDAIKQGVARAAETVSDVAGAWVKDQSVDVSNGKVTGYRVTLKITFLSLGLAVLGGVGLSILFTQSKWMEMSFFPFAVVLQVTPIVAIFPLINIYVNDQTAKLLLCAWIVAFFPILSNTTLGLNSVDRNLLDLFKLNGATRWQTLRLLKLPAAMPYFLGGLKIAGGLSLIGAVVAEFVAGSAGQSSGLASRIIEAGYRLNAPRLFAALILISFTGIVIFLVLTWISNQLLKGWHESALKRDH